MFYYVNFLTLVFTEGILGISFCHSIIQKKIRTVRKQYIFKILGENKMLYIIKQMIYEQGPQ